MKFFTTIWKWLKKLDSDTLRTPDTGKYSRKSLTALLAMLNAVAMGWWLLLAEKGTVNIYSISVFYGFLGLGGGTLALTVIDKLRK